MTKSSTCNYRCWQYGGRGTHKSDTCKWTKNVEIKSVCDVNSVKPTRPFHSGKGMRDIDQNFGKDMKAVFQWQGYWCRLDFNSRTLHALATVWACQAGKGCIRWRKKPKYQYLGGKKNGWSSREIQLELSRWDFQTEVAAFMDFRPRLYKKRANLW